MIFAVDAIPDINKWFACIKRKTALKLLHFSLKQKYAKCLEVIWIISDVNDISSYKSKTCLLHQNLDRLLVRAIEMWVLMEAVMSKWKKQTNFLQVYTVASFGVRLPFLSLAFYKGSLLTAGLFWLRDLHCTMKTPVPFALKDLYLLLFNDILFL